MRVIDKQCELFNVIQAGTQRWTHSNTSLLTREWIFTGHHNVQRSAGRKSQTGTLCF